MLAEREIDINGVIPVWRTVQHMDKQEVVVEGKGQPKVLLVARKGEGRTQTVGNGVLDINCNVATGTGFRPVEPEKTIPRERYRGTRDILWEEGFYSS